MPNFHYQALDRDQRLVSGEIQADSVTLAVAQLEADGLSVQAIGSATTDTSSVGHDKAYSPTTSSPPVSLAPVDRDQELLQAQIATIFDRSQPIVPALCSYASEMPAFAQRRQLEQLADTIQNRNLKQALRNFTIAPDYWLALLGAASTSSDPLEIFRQFVYRAGLTAQFRYQWRRVLAYPMLVGCLAIAVLTSVSLMVTPKFRDIYNSFDMSLPAITELTLGLSALFVSGRILFVLFVLVLAWFLLRFVVRLLPENLLLAARRLLAWRRVRAVRSGKLALYLADLLEGGAAPADALRLAGLLVDRRVMQAATNELARDLHDTHAVPRYFVCRHLSSTVVYALQADMSTAARIRLLREISMCRLIEGQGDSSHFMNVAGPLSLIFIGAVVGLVVVSLFLPLIKLLNALT